MTTATDGTLLAAAPGITSQQSTRFAALDGLRAFAALAVVATHVGDATAGIPASSWHGFGLSFPTGLAIQQLNFGVEVFFVISAFLVYRPFLAAHVAGRTHPEPIRFLWRRAWRIYPAYWVALGLIVMLFATKSLPGTEVKLTNALLIHDYAPIRWSGANIGLRHAWTLVVEISFYVFVPFWAWSMRGLGRLIGALRAEVVGALLLIPLGPFFVWYFRVTDSHGIARHATPVLLQVLPRFIGVFAWGMLFAAVSVWHERRSAAHPAYAFAARVSWLWWSLATGVFIWFVSTIEINPLAAFTITPRQQVVERFVHGLVAALLVAPAVIGAERGGGIRTGLRWKPLAFVGVVSYGFYLWHYAVIDFLSAHVFTTGGWTTFSWIFASTVVAATALGAASWYAIERPCIAFSHGRARRSAVVAVGGAAAFVIPTALIGRALRVRVYSDSGFVGRLESLVVASAIVVAMLGVLWLILRDSISRPDGKLAFRRPTFGRGLAAIAVVSFGWRVFFVLANVGRIKLNGDAWYYNTQANDLAHGRWFIDPSQFAYYGRVTPSAGHPPTYLLYLAAVSKWVGESQLTHRLASTVLGGITVVLIGLLARSLFNDDRVGWLAAGFAGVYGHLWINDEMLMSEGMYQLWTVVAVIASYRFWRNPKRSTAAWMGAAVGLAALSRAEAIALFAFLVIPLALTVKRRDGPDEQGFSLGTRMRFATVGCLVGALTLAPWVLFNVGRFAHPVVMSNGIGSVLMVANCPYTYTDSNLGYWSIQCAEGLPTLQHGDESEKEVVWRKRGLDYIKSHERQYPKVTLLRVLRMWDLAFTGQNVHPNNADLEGRGGWQSVLATVQYFLLLALAIHGLLLLWRRRISIIPFVAFAAVITITAAITFGITRYRAPVDALMLAPAAGAIFARLDRLRA